MSNSRGKRWCCGCVSVGLFFVESKNFNNSILIIDGVVSERTRKLVKLVSCMIGFGVGLCIVVGRWRACLGDDWNCWLRVRDSVWDMTLRMSSSPGSLSVWMVEMFIKLLESG